MDSNKIYLVSSVIPFDDNSKFHVTLSGLEYDTVLCKKQLSPGRFAIITTHGAADHGESKEYSVDEFRKMPRACKSCLKALDNLK